MSVRSKALRFAILVSAIVSVLGCSAVGSSFDAEQETVTNQGTTDGVVYGDSGDQSSAAEAKSTAVTGSDISNLAVKDSSELLKRGKNSLGLRLERGEGFSRMLIEMAKVEPVFDVMMLDNPSRLVVDILGERGKTNRDLAVSSDPFMSRVRVGAHNDRTRVVFDIKKEAAESKTADHLIDTEGGKLSVTFFDNAVLASKKKATAEAAAVQVAQLPKEEPAQPVVEKIEPAKPVTEVAEGLATNPELKPVEEAAVPAQQEVAEVAQADEAPAASRLSVNTLKFEKAKDSAGMVRIDLSDAAGFELKRTAPSEYVMTIPGAQAAENTTYPQIAPKSFPGMRSARAVQKGSDVLVRMFVDPTTELQATTRGNQILVQAKPMLMAEDPAARAQLEAADQPTTAPAAAPVSEEEQARQNPTGIRSADGSKVYTGRLISLDLQDTDIDNALRIIAEVSNLNIIASDDVSGKVTLRLIDVPWDQALDVILKTNGLDQVTEGNVIRIAPVDKLRQEREALREAKRAAENLEDLTVQYIRVSYARVTELKEQVESVLSERGTASIDERTNQLIVKDIKKGHERAVELIKKLDLRTPQVLLETQIVEGQRNILRDLGFQWNFTYTQSPATGNATGLNFPNSIGIAGSGTADGSAGNAVNFPAVLDDASGSAISAILDSADGSRSLSMRVSALETEGKVKVISRPQVATVNNKQAEIRSVETVRVRLPDSGTSIATGAGASASGGGRTAFEEIDVGITLRVTPQASPDYYVLLDVDAKSSTFGSSSVDNIPSTLERQATSTILVKSGQTFALGGVYRLEDADTVSGVPFLKDIPVLGVLFRRSLLDKSDEELIFFITPHIVEGSFDPSLM